MNNQVACDMAPWMCEGNGRGVVSCDWFAVSCMLSEPRGDKELIPPPGCSVVKMSSTAVWADRFFILDAGGNKVATVLCTPRTPQIDCCRCLVEVANRWLYYDDFEGVLDGVLGCLNMAVTGLNRVDLCCDFEMTPKLWKVFVALSKGDAYVKALKEGVVWWKMLKAGSHGDALLRVPHCITWGGKDSLIKWKIYYKWLELQEAAPDGKKPYIEDLWRAVGFNSRAVWRIEVSVRSSNKLADAGGSRVSPLVWYNDRTRLFCDLYTDKFVVRKAEGHKDKRNDRVLDFLKVDGSKSLWHALPRSEREGSDCECRIACKLWKELQQIDVQANDLLLWNVKNSLEQLCESPAVVNALCKVYNVAVSDIVMALQV